MTVTTDFPYNKQYVEEFSTGKNEPDWMKSLRLQALDLVDSLDLPKPDKTNIRRWNFTNFKHYAEGETISSLTALPETLQDYFDQKNLPENVIIQRNNTVAYTQTSEGLKEQGVIFTDIFTAIKDHSDLVEKYYMKDAVGIDEHKLTALHAALMNGGVFIYIPEGVELEEPLQTVFWQEDAEAALFNHVLLVAGDNSKVSYVENYISTVEGEETVANVIAEVHAGKNAKVLYGGVDNFGAATTTYINRRGVAADHAVLDWALGQMNEGRTVSENDSVLVGQYAKAYPKTVTVGVGNQIQNFTARTHHFGKDTDGQILQHGVLQEATTAIFNAIGEIENGATRANAEQDSRILMLSGDARGDANPILLIEEDDVTAGHAASVGRIDETQLYYMMSRGISREDASRLIIHGFLEPVVSILPIESVKNQLKHLIERKIV